MDWKKTYTPSHGACLLYKWNYILKIVIICGYVAPKKMNPNNTFGKISYFVMEAWAHMLLTIPNNNTKACNVLFRILGFFSTFH
jgi:hypothetical protein